MSPPSSPLPSSPSLSLSSLLPPSPDNIDFKSGVAQTLAQSFPRTPHSMFSWEIKRNHFAKYYFCRGQHWHSAHGVECRVWRKIYLQPSLLSLTWRANWSCDSGIAILHSLHWSIHHTVQSSPPAVKHPPDLTCNHPASQPATTNQRNKSGALRPGETVLSASVSWPEIEIQKYLLRARQQGRFGLLYYSHQWLENYRLFSFFETENWKPGCEQEGKSIFSFLCAVEWGDWFTLIQDFKVIFIFFEEIILNNFFL